MVLYIMTIYAFPYYEMLIVNFQGISFILISGIPQTNAAITLQPLLPLLLQIFSRFLLRVGNWNVGDKHQQHNLPGA